MVTSLKESSTGFRETSKQVTWSQHVQSWENTLDSTGTFLVFRGASISLRCHSKHWCILSASPSSLCLCCELARRDTMSKHRIPEFPRTYWDRTLNASALGALRFLLLAPVFFVGLFSVPRLYRCRALRHNGHYFVTLAPTLSMLWNNFLKHTKNSARTKIHRTEFHKFLCTFTECTFMFNESNVIHDKHFVPLNTTLANNQNTCMFNRANGMAFNLCHFKILILKLECIYSAQNNY